MNNQATTVTQPATTDFTAIKAKQRSAWGAGDYAVVGVTLQLVGEQLCEAMDLRAGSRVLDVAAGNGNVSLAAARRFATVTCTDYVPALLDHAAQRAVADGLEMSFQAADVEDLPFADAEFDYVTSTFGAMFAPDHKRTAEEMFRVCRPGGTIGMANWTPDSFIGGLFKTLGGYVPPAPGLKSPALWGQVDHLRALFPDARTIACERRVFNLRYASPEAWLTLWQQVYGPLQKAFEALSPADQQALEADLLRLVAAHNVAQGDDMVVPSSYLEVIISR